eukprot:m.201247 g.201247  ORF g.201247 m.201247 type:complete len:257 (+) comp15501_c0_seq4:97-867(+)
MGKKTILYVHGLESGPTGRKYQLLKKAGFNVISLRMPCDRRSIVKDPIILGALFMLVAAPLTLGLTVGAVFAVPAFAATLLAQFFLKHYYVRRLLKRSVAVQTAALRGHPEIVAVVGSSFGGAVAVELLRSGLWTGPTLLLAPAQHRLAKLARLPAPRLPASASALIVHGVHDDVVPLSHSHMLVREAGPNTSLLEVDDDHRLNALATAENLAAWLARVLALPGPPEAREPAGEFERGKHTAGEKAKLLQNDSGLG